MSNSLFGTRRSFDSGIVTLGGVVLGLLAVFWTSAELGAMGVAVPVIRPAAGLVLVLFAPGALLAQLVDVRPDRFGTFALFAVALSIGVLTAINLFGSFVLAPLGVARPLSFLPLALVLSFVLVGLLSLVYVTDTTVSVPPIRLSGPVLAVLLLIFLPFLAAVAVAAMSQFGTNAGMFLFVGAVIAVTLLAATDLLPASLYPLAVFCVAISVLLHRNLLTGHVVGADIQVSYFLADLLQRTEYWAPDLGGSLMSLPVVTSVPATITMLTGLQLATTFKVVYVFLFSLVPVGVFYVGSHVFDDRIGLFGSLFFVFYHGSFYFTPGKQLVSELFVVAVLLLLVRGGFDTLPRKVALFVLSLTLMSTHYGMTYAFGTALIVGYVGLRAVQRAVSDFDHDLSPWYPVGLLAMATAFYAYSAPALVDRLLSIPLGIVDQVVALALTGSVPGSGASYVGSQSGFLDSLTLYLYFLLTGLVGLGLTRDAVRKLFRLRNGESPAYVEYTALAVPLFAFLGSSYVVNPNLYADRVYQLVLVVLAPYAVLGYRTVLDATAAAFDRTGVAARAGGVRDRVAAVQWTPLAVVLAVLLALNSGMAFSLAGSAETASFDEQANDLTFTVPERDGATWLSTNAGVERYDRLRSSQFLSARETVPIYTEVRSYQLLRSTALPGYTNADLRTVKSRWRPTVYPDTIGDGYVFVRERSVSDGESAGDVPPSFLSRDELREISVTRNRIYSSEAALVVESDNSTAA